MYPEDGVLVGVINRRRDLEAAHEGWYRIPVERAPRSLAYDIRYLAFYLSRTFGSQNGGIWFYAPLHGHELVRRRDLLPDEADHPRADGLYYKMQIGPLCPRTPPIQNPAHRPVAFLFTTWDRFVAARTLADLFRRDAGFVIRIARPLTAPRRPLIWDE